MTGPKKYLGQHFLTSPATARKIAEAVPAGDARAPSAANVLEIGPGRGALTACLIERFPALHLVEIDRDAVDTLRGKLGAGGYTVHNEDVMTFDYARAGFPLHVVGNLPYNIGARIIKRTLMYAPDVLSCTFMVQREVALRAASEPRRRSNGWLSVFCQFFGETKLLFNVPPGSFFPRPNVDSSVFRIVVDIDTERKLERELWEDFFSFVDVGFSMRRKQVAKTLSMRYGRGKDFYGGALSDIGMDAASRAEDLGAGDWLKFYKRVCGYSDYE